MTASETLIVFAMIVLGSFVVGCGGSALATNAAIARGALEAQVQSGPMILDLREDAAVTAGTEAHAQGLPESDAQAAATETANEWQCAIDGHRIYSAAVSAYIDALSLWNAGAKFDLARALPFVARLVEAYRALRSCMLSLDDEAELGGGFLNMIPQAWGLTDGR